MLLISLNEITGNILAKNPHSIPPSATLTRHYYNLVMITLAQFRSPQVSLNRVDGCFIV